MHIYKKNTRARARLYVCVMCNVYKMGQKYRYNKRYNKRSHKSIFKKNVSYKRCRV